MRQEMRYRIIFEEQLHKRICLNFISKKDTLDEINAAIDEGLSLSEIDNTYVKSMAVFVKEDPFENAYFLHGMVNQFTNMNAKYVDLIILHYGEEHDHTQEIWMETDIESTEKLICKNLDQFYNYGWDMMPLISQIYIDGNLVADFTWESLKE